MSNTHILLFLLLCLSNIIIVFNSALKPKANHLTPKNESKNEFKERSNKKIFSKRKANDLEDDPKVKFDDNDDNDPTISVDLTPDELTYVPLKILIDTQELTDSCPNGKEEFIINIVKAMEEAKKIL